MPKILHPAKIIWIILFCSAFPIISSASLYCPSSYARFSPDNQFMLVMRSPVKTEYDNGRVFKLPSGQQIDLREKFKTNGVYRLDNFDCVQPLDWFADDGELFTSEDFNILIRLNRFAVETQNRTNGSWCLKFYNRGREGRQYQVKELVGIPHSLFLPLTSYGWHSVWDETGAFTYGSGLYAVTGSYYSQSQFVLVTEPQFFGRIKLSDGNVFVFNPFTGEIIQQWRHHPMIKFSIIVIIFLLFCAFTIFLCVKVLKKLIRKIWPKKV
jgi:hypothetical protein